MDPEKVYVPATAGAVTVYVKTTDSDRSRFDSKNLAVPASNVTIASRRLEPE